MKQIVDNSKDAAREIARKYGVKLDIEALNSLTAALQPRKFKHKAYIYLKGEIIESLFFLSKGLVRQVKSVHNLDIVEDLCHEGDMLISANSMMGHVPSEVDIQTLEPTLAYELEYRDLKELATKYNDINDLLCNMLEDLLIKEIEKRHRLDDTPMQRYTNLLESDGEIIRRSPLKNVASYLRMAPETLSRVRNAINKSENSNS